MSDIKPGSTVANNQVADASMQKAKGSKIATQPFGSTPGQKISPLIGRLSGIETTPQSIQMVKKLIDFIKTL